jgi:CelD/BcsL family acetyltransferase involved in cellulose biosynthesis
VRHGGCHLISVTHGGYVELLSPHPASHAVVFSIADRPPRLPPAFPLQAAVSRTAPIAAGDSSAGCVRALRDISQLHSLEEDWRKLEPGVPPMQHYDWSLAAAQAFCQQAPFAGFALEHRNRLHAVAPLVCRRSPLPRFEILGAAELGEPVDLISDSSVARLELLEAVEATGRPLYIERVFADSRLVDDVRQTYRRGLVMVRPASACPRIALDETWREPERKMGRAHRKDFRRRQNIAASLGDVAYQSVAPDAGALPALLEEAYRVEEHGWKGKNGTALARDRPLGAFFRQYASAARDAGMLRLLFMRIDGQAVAMQIAVESGGSCWGLKIGYDEAYRRCSPGKLLMLHILRDAAARGLHSYEFLGGEEAWISNWTSEARPCVSLRAYPPNVLSLCQFAVDVAQWGWKKLRRSRRTH